MRPDAEPRTTKRATGQDGVFLERRIYRRRRLIDGAKLLPLLAALMFLLPALIAGAQSEGGASTAMRLVYFFFVWFAMIMVAATVARSLDQSGRASTDAETATDPDENGSG